MKVVILGDSYVERAKPHFWRLVTLPPNITVELRGRGGRKASELTSDMIPADADALILHVGANDLGKQLPKDVCDTISTLIYNTMKNGISLVSIVPFLKRERINNAHCNCSIKDYNIRVENLGPLLEARGFNIIQIPEFVRPTSDLYLDGIHLSKPNRWSSKRSGMEILLTAYEKEILRFSELLNYSAF